MSEKSGEKDKENVDTGNYPAEKKARLPKIKSLAKRFMCDPALFVLSDLDEVKRGKIATMITPDRAGKLRAAPDYGQKIATELAAQQSQAQVRR